MTGGVGWLDEVEQRIEGATAGPWEMYRYRTGGGRIHVSGDDGRQRALIADMEGDPDQVATVYNEADREFLFAARTDLPRAVEALRKVLALCDEAEADPLLEYDSVWTRALRAAIEGAS